MSVFKRSSCFVWHNILGTLSLFLAFFVVSSRSDGITDAGYLSATILTVFSLLLLFGKLQIVELLRQSKKADLFFVGFLACLLTVMISYKELFATGIFLSTNIAVKTLAYFVFIPMYLVACYLVLLYATNRLLNPKKQAYAPCMKTVWICTAVLSAVSFIVFLSCPNGLLYEDGSFMWEQALHNTYSDWHPICFILFVKLCSLIAPHPVFLMLVQTIAWSLTNHLILRILNRQCGKRACKTYAIFSLTMGIMAYKYVVYLYKELLFTMAVLGFCACLFDYTRGNRTWKTCLLLFVYGLIAALTRHMMILPIALTLFIVIISELIRKRKLIQKKMLVQLTVILALLLISNSVIHTSAMKLTNAEENADYVAYTIPIYMLGAYAASDFEIDNETVELMERVMPVDEWEQGYHQNIYWADTLTRQWGYIGSRIMILDEEITGKELIAANFRFFIDHPFYYVKCLSEISSLVWEISRPEGYAEWFYPMMDNNTEGPAYRPVEGYEEINTGFAAPLNSIFSFVYNTPVIYNIVCRGGASLFVILWMLYILFRKRNGMHMYCTLPTLIITMLLILSMPAPDPRYILIIIATAVLMLAIVCNIPAKNPYSLATPEKDQAL